MPRIRYAPYSSLDEASRTHLDYARAHGTPRPESQAIRAHVPKILETFTATWRASFDDGEVENGIKELCRVYVSKTVECEYCGAQRSEEPSAQKITPDMRDEIVNFERSHRFSTQERAALRYAQAIAWDAALADDEMWADLQMHFTDPQIVELGYFIALTLGQQRWIKTLDLRHREYLGDTEHGLEPVVGMEPSEAR
ncbi:MAG TPA: hypothetical protein VMO47_06950 [Rhodothermales bacterium]|nr:hypothetical protein [Rhodothermales bacterium]